MAFPGAFGICFGSTPHTYACHTPRAFAPSKVSLPCGINDGIQAFSPENRACPRYCFGKGRLLFARFPFLPGIHMNKK
jgi:hypothetical protein